MSEWLYGPHAALEALRAGRRQVKRLFIQAGPRTGTRLRLERLARARRIAVKEVPKETLRLVARTSHHQGVALEVGGYPYSSLGAILQRVSESPEPALVLVLDQIQDPRNLGALLRTADAVGVHGVLIPKRGRVGVTPTVVHASAGAAEHLLIAPENLAQALQSLKEHGLWVYGLEAGPAAKPIHQSNLRGPLAWVVGSEGTGLRRLVRERCDERIFVPMRGRVPSLNAAVAGALALYFTWQARGWVGAPTTWQPPGTRPLR